MTTNLTHPPSTLPDPGFATAPLFDPSREQVLATFRENAPPVDEGIRSITARSVRASKRILILGRSPQVQHQLREPLLALGVSALFSTHPEHAAELFDARNFDLIVFGYGIGGALSERLQRDFTRQDPQVSYLEAYAPVVLRQIAAELERDGKPQQYVADFRVVDDGPDLLLQATILKPCTVRVEVCQEPGAPPPLTRLIDQSEARPGPFERWIKPSFRTHGFMLVMTVDEKEFFLFRMKPFA